MLASAAAGSVLEISDDVHRLGRLCFSLLGCFCFCLFFCQAAIRCLTVVSALVPMAQMKPNSSRATAVVIFLLTEILKQGLHGPFLAAQSMQSMFA